MTAKLLALFIALSVIAAGCGGGDDDPSAQPDEPDSDATGADGSAQASPTDAAPTAAPTPPPAPTAVPEPPFRVATDVIDPTGTGVRTIQPVSNAALPDGYTEEEFLFGGDAVGYRAVGELTADGVWKVEETETTGYRSRMIVRRPTPEAFSGVVLVEWFNVTAGADTSPDWAYLSEEIARSGHVYVGVSAQSVGLNGTEGDFIGGGLINTSGLIAQDEERYGSLVHPGDAWSFDIFTQAGAVVAGLAETDVLGGLDPTHVIAMGESQSAGFMTTYVNAVHPLAGLYDGFLIHSRGAFGPTPSGERLDAEQAAVRTRTDLDTPVFVYEAETDLVGLGYVSARQPDSEFVTVWESAGTAHADAHSLAVSIGAPRSPDLGALLGCESGINDGPHHETLQAGVRHLVAWVVDGTPMPPSPDLLIENGVIVRDELGIAIGGIRTPPVDVPLRVLSGDPGPDGGACFLFGTTTPIEPSGLAALYVDEADYVATLIESADAAVAAGWLLPEDAETMVAEETARYQELTTAAEN